MTKKKYYNEHGNQIRSRPRKRFYKKWWFWLMIIFLLIIIIVTINAYIGKKDVIDEPTVSETVKTEDEVNGMDDVEVENMEKDVEERTYTYKDFQGTYALFDGDPYESGASVRYKLEENQYRVDDFWEFGLKVDILNKNIEGNVLTIEYDVEDYEYYGFDEKHIKEKFELRQEGDSKTLHSLTSGNTLYSISKDDLQNHYDQLEIDYARIVTMIMGGNIPLDGWAMSSPVTMHVSHSLANEPLDGWGGAPSYPKNVTHLTSDLLDDLSHLSDLIKNGTITYFAHGDGNITIYQLNKDGAEKVSQEVIEEVGTIYVDPSEPYLVADFIGRVEFVYE